MTRRFWMPGDRWDTVLLEQWLEERAAAGWFPKKFGGLFGKFEQGEPQALRFRLEPERPETFEQRQEREAAYEDMGWQFAAILGDYRVYRCADPAAPELYTDPTTEGWAWDRQTRRLRRQATAYVLLLLFWTVWQFRHLWESSTPLELVLRGMWAVWLFVLWVCAKGIYDMARQLRGVRHLRRQREAGVSPVRDADVARAIRRRKGRELADWGSIALLLLFLVLTVQTQERWDLSEAPAPLPYVTMEVLDPAAAGEMMDTQQYRERGSLLMPRSCEIEQWQWDGPFLEARFDRLRFTALAEPLYKERLTAYQEEYAGMTLEVLTDPRFDQAVLLTARGESEDRLQILLARRGDAILEQRVRLNTDLRDHLDDFAAVLAENS